MWLRGGDMWRNMRCDSKIPNQNSTLHTANAAYGICVYLQGFVSNCWNVYRIDFGRNVWTFL